MTEGDISSDSDSGSAESDAPTVASDKEEEQYYTGGRYKKRKQRAGSAASNESLIGVQKSVPLMTEHEYEGAVHERTIEVLPPYEGKLVLLGSIISVVQTVIVVQASNPNGECLQEGSLLCLQDRKVIGPIFETFGPLESPFYSVRLASAEDYLLAPQHGDPVSTKPLLRTGIEVYYCPTSEYVTVLRTNEINRSKGTDASNIYDEEPGADEIEFSDDEAERAYKASLRVAKTSRKDKDRRKLETKLAEAKSEGEGGEEYTPLQRPSDGFPLPARPPVGRVLENPEEIGLNDSLIFSDGDSIMGDSNKSIELGEEKSAERSEEKRPDRSDKGEDPSRNQGEGSSRGQHRDRGQNRERGQDRGRGRGRGAKRGRGGKDAHSSNPRPNGLPTGPRGGGNWRGNDRNDRGRGGRDDRGARGRPMPTEFSNVQRQPYSPSQNSPSGSMLPPLPPPGLRQPPSGLTYPLPLPPRGMLPPASLALSAPGPMSMLPMSSPIPPPPPPSFSPSGSGYDPSAPSPMNSPAVPILQPPPVAPSPSTSHNRKWSNPALKAKTDAKEGTASESKPASPVVPALPTPASTFPAQPFPYNQNQFPQQGFPQNGFPQGGFPVFPPGQPQFMPMGGAPFGFGHSGLPMSRGYRGSRGRGGQNRQS